MNYFFLLVNVTTAYMRECMCVSVEQRYGLAGSILPLVGGRAGVRRAYCLLVVAGDAPSSRVVVHHFLLFSFSYPPYCVCVCAGVYMSSHSLVRDGPSLNVSYASLTRRNGSLTGSRA